MDTNRFLTELRAERARIDEVIRAIEAISSDGATRPRGSATRTTPQKRRISAAGRKRLSEALKRRWAQGKMGKMKAAAPQAAAKNSPRKRGITAAGRKRLSEMMKRRWKERRKATSKTA